MRVACVVLFATSVSGSPMFPLGLDEEVQEATRPFLEVDALRPAGYCLDSCYALPVWGWRDNPHGTFVDFNTNVSCDGFVPTS